MNRIIIFFLLFGFTQAYGQQDIKGIVVSQGDSVQAIPYVSICKKHQFQGTMSNLKGEFCLKNVLPDDTLVFSSIGFKPQILVLKKNRLDQFITINLLPETYTINEVSVSAFTATGIISEAKKRLSLNCPESPTRITGGFRKQVVEDGKYAFLGNSLLDVDCPKFWTDDGEFSKKDFINARNLNEKITEDKIDKSIDIEIKPVDVLKSIYPQFILSLTDFFDLRIEKIIQTDSSNVYKIHFKTLTKYWDTYPFEGNMYVENSNYALICFELETFSPDQNFKTFSVKDKKTYHTELHTNKAFRRVEYKKYSDRWILSYCKSLWDFDTKSERDEANHHYILVSDFMVNKALPYEKNIPVNQRIDLFKDLFNKMGKKPTSAMDSLNVIQPDYGTKDRY